MKNSLTSINTPIYNRVNNMKETLISLLNKNYINWNCILVDEAKNGTVVTGIIV